MEAKEIIEKADEQMAKSFDYAKKQIEKVRTGRASVSLVENVKVDYYGTPTPLSQVASLSAPDARTIIAQPWDKSSLQNIEKAIMQADLGLNPQNDGNIIRIPVPPLTEERRKEYVKVCKKLAEDGKIAIRNIRRERVEKLKKEEKAKNISEDERRRGEEEIQKLTDKYIDMLDKELAKKEKELMED